MHLPALVTALLFAGVPTAGYLAPPAEPAVPAVVSVAWLKAHLSDPKLIVLNVGPKTEYDSLHIPGARYADFHSFTSPMKMDGTDKGLSLELPTPARFDSTLSSLGISNDSRIVVYTGAGWFTPTARLELTLEWAGYDGRVGVLDGGIEAWRRTDGAFTTETPAVTPTKVAMKAQPGLIVTADFVREHLKDPQIVILDARDAGFYLDTIKTRMPRGGHIPGAHSVPYTSLTDSSDNLKPAAQLKQIFQAAGAVPGKTVVVYCHIGQQGSWVRFVAHSLGYDARLYDGSFEEWSARSDLPVEGERRHAASGGQ